MQGKALVLFLQFLFIFCAHGEVKKQQYFNPTNPSPKHDNPNFVRDRFKNEINKPQLPDTWNDRYRKPFNPAWMDYCDPYHCNDYHKTACGLNRKTMRFQWFQSVCHIITNNQCAQYRGALKFDIVDNKFCRVYVMYLRSNCPNVCDDEVDPICAIDSDNQAVLFKNRCAMEVLNCKKKIPDYNEVHIDVCEYYLRHGYSQ